MRTSEEKLQLKKLTLTAWTDILLSKGMIDVQKCNRMKALINKM